MNEVPIAIDDEMARARPMYLSFGSNVLVNCCAASCAALIASIATLPSSHTDCVDENVPLHRLCCLLLDQAWRRFLESATLKSFRGSRCTSSQPARSRAGVQRDELTLYSESSSARAERARGREWRSARVDRSAAADASWTCSQRASAEKEFSFQGCANPVQSIYGHYSYADQG